MVEIAALNLPLELESEKRLLQKADADIEAGRQRVRGQQNLVTALRDSGHNTAQAERLVGLLTDTLAEWERHRVLIRQRIAYLEGQVPPDQV